MFQFPLLSLKIIGSLDAMSKRIEADKKAGIETCLDPPSMKENDIEIYF